MKVLLIGGPCDKKVVNIKELVPLINVPIKENLNISDVKREISLCNNKPQNRVESYILYDECPPRYIWIHEKVREFERYANY